MASKKKHFGIKVLFQNYSFKFFLRGTPLPIIITAGLIFCFNFFTEVNKETIINLTEIGVSIIPSMLGFVLSGYALLIGFSKIDIIAKKQSNSEISKRTLYQKVSSVFAFSLIFQIMLLALLISLKMFLRIELACLFDDFTMCILFNNIIFAIILFGMLYTLVMIKDLVINIFNLSQVNHYRVNRK